MKQLRKIYYILEFLIYYFYQLIKANFFIAYNILKPKITVNPGFINIEPNLKSELGLLLLSNLISMTPGSLSVDLSNDKKTLIVHLLFIEDKEEALNVIKKIESKVERITS